MGRMGHRGNVYPVKALSILQIPIVKLTCGHYIVRVKHVSPLYYFAFAIIYVPASGCLNRHTIPAFMATLPGGLARRAGLWDTWDRWMEGTHETHGIHGTDGT